MQTFILIPDDVTPSSLKFLENLPTLTLNDSILKQTTEVINTAFVEGDSFFKKLEFVQRLSDTDELKDLVSRGFQGVENAKNPEVSLFLVATDDFTKEIIGSVRLYWNSEKPMYPDWWDLPCTTEPSTIPEFKPQAYFGMLSVPSRNGKRGIGSTLVKFAEHVAETLLARPIMRIPVISIRQDLYTFYNKLGYEKVGFVRPFEAPEILLPEYSHLGFQMMTKQLQ